MKIALTSEATNALKKILEQVKTKNEFAYKRFSPLVNELIIDTYKSLETAQVERLAEKLMSPKEHKKALLKRLEKVAEVLGEDSISRLERTAKRHKKISANRENTA